MKKSIVGVIIVIIALSIMLTGCNLLKTDEVKEKVYTKGDFSITLPDGLTEKEMVQFTAMWQNDEIIVSMLKEEFVSLSVVNIFSYSTIEDYMRVVIANNNLTVDELTDAETGLVYFSHEKHISGNDYYYYVSAYKGSDAFWLCNFACLASQKSKYESLFPTWAATVKVN